MDKQAVSTQLIRGNRFDFEFITQDFMLVNEDADVAYPVSGDQIAKARAAK